MKKTIIGIDIAKETFVSAVLQAPHQKYQVEEWSYKTSTHIEEFIATLSCERDHIVMENTGVYHKRLAFALLEKGFSVSVCHSTSLAHYGKMKKSITKTDAKDAILIAQYGETEAPALYQKPEDKQAHFQQQRNLIQTLKQELRAALNRQHAQSYNPQVCAICKKMIADQIAFFQQQLADLKVETEAHLEEEDTENFNNLIQIPAIGATIAAELIAAKNSFVGFYTQKNAKAFSKYLGLVPRIQESGKTKKASHITPAALPSLRAMLFMGVGASVNLSKKTNCIKTFFQHLRQRGKSYKQAIIACCHKVVRIAFAILKNNVPFSEEKYGLIPQNSIFSHQTK
jgi:transposase